MDKGGFRFEISGFRFVGNDNGMKALCNIFSADVNTNFDGELNVRKDMTLENCDIRAKSNSFVANSAAAVAKSRVNSKFKDKPLVRDTDLKQNFPIKVRDKDYILFLQVFKVTPLSKNIKIESELFLESQ